MRKCCQRNFECLFHLLIQSTGKCIAIATATALSFCAINYKFSFLHSDRINYARARSCTILRALINFIEILRNHIIQFSIEPADSVKLSFNYLRDVRPEFGHNTSSFFPIHRQSTNIPI